MHLWHTGLQDAAELGALNTMTDARNRLLADRYLLKRLLSVLGSMRDEVGDQRAGPSVSSGAWIGYDTHLGTKVFIKLLSADTSSEIVRAYHDLWQRLMRVQHPGIPATLYHGVDGGQSFVVTEWVNALTLEDAEIPVRMERISVDQLIEMVAVGTLEALAALNRGGFVHGDISPSNIMLSKALDKVWLVDPAPKLAAGQLMTTFAWAAPELREGFPPTPRSDLYALGSVLQRLAERHGAFLPPSLDRLAERDLRWRPKDAEQALAHIREWRLATKSGTDLERYAASDAIMRLSEDEDRARAVAERLRQEREFAAKLEAERRASAFAQKADPSFNLPSPAIPRPPALSGGSAGSIGSLVEQVARGLGSLARKIRPSGGKAAGPSLPLSVDDDAKERGSDAATAQTEPGDWSDRTSIANVPIISRNHPEPVDADFVVMGPTIVEPRRPFPLELWMGRSSDAGLLRERAQERGIFSDRGNLSKVTLPSHTILTLSMSLPGFTIANPIEHITWDGSIRNAAFILHSNEGLATGQHWGTLKLLIDAKPLGMISFCVELGHDATVQPDTKATLSEPMQRFRTAFASYASPDRAEVFKRVQAIRASRVDVFADIADLRGGERWEDVLMREIDTRDVFYLFWSQQAAASPWVEREWRRAIDTRGVGFICPIPLEDPRFAQPPAELAELHFNDWCLAIIQSEQAMASDGGYQGKS